MKKNAIILSALILILSVLLVFAGCNEAKLTGIEITNPPTKTTYTEGETFSPAGMKVTANYSDGTNAEITDYTVSKTTALAVTDTEITVSYKEFSAKINITVKAAPVTVTGIQVDETAVYTRTMDMSSIIRYKKIWSDGKTDDDWTEAAPEDLVSYTIDGDKITLVLSILAGTGTFDKTVTLDIADGDVISVSELKTKTPDDEQQYLVEGIVTAVMTVKTNVIEYIIKDVSADVYIGITDIASTGKMADGDYVSVFQVGDKVRLPVSLTKVLPAEGAYDNNEAAALKKRASDDNKICAEYKGGQLFETGVVASGADVTFDKASATAISTQEQLKTFLSAENRAGNAYSLVKLTGPFYCINYVNGTSEFYRFMFEGVTSYANQKIDGSDTSPVFANYNQLYSTGETAGEILAGDAEWAPTAWANPGATCKDVYALFAGGNTYYHHFVILDYETNESLTLASKELTVPQVNYITGNTFSVEGGKLVLNYGKGAYDSDILYTVPLTEALLDPTTLPDMNTVGTYTVTGSYGGVDFQFEVIVDQAPQSIEFTSAPQTDTFNYRTWQKDALTAFTGLELTVTYSTGDPDVLNINESMLSFEATAEWNKFNVVVTYWDAKTTCEITVTVPTTPTTVTEAKALAAGDTIYDLNGIVVSSAFISGTAASPANGEIFIKDKTSGAVIGLKDMGITASDKLAGLSVGDEIIVPVTMKVTTKTANTSENGKITAYKITDGNVMVISKNNSAAIGLDTAVTVSNQAELQAFLADAATRCGNMYKLVKFAAGTRYINYSGSLYITFNQEATAVANIQIDEKTPFLSIMNQPMTLGDKTYGDMLLGEGKTFTGSFADSVTLEKDVYLLYVGGQGKYYHQFVLLGADYIQTPAAD